MEKRAAKKTGVLGVLGESLRLYGKAFVPALVLYVLNFSLYGLVRLGFPVMLALGAGWKKVALSFLFVVGGLAVISLQGCLNLAIIYFLRNAGKGGVLFVPALKDACGRLRSYLKSFFLWVALSLAYAAGAYGFILLGRLFYFSKLAFAGPVKFAVLLVSHAFGVTLFICSIWYGFFFSLGALVNAFENKGPWKALRESRARLKGNTAWYLGVALVVVGINFGAVLLAYTVAYSLSLNWVVPALIEPVVLTLLGPLGLSVWWVSYQGMAEGR